MDHDHDPNSYSHEPSQNGGNDHFQYDQQQQQFPPPDPVVAPQQQQQPPPPQQGAAGVGYQFNMSYQNGNPAPGPNHNHYPTANFPPQSPQGGGKHPTPTPKYQNGTHQTAGYGSTVNFPPGPGAGAGAAGYYQNGGGGPQTVNFPPRSPTPQTMLPPPNTVPNGFPVPNPIQPVVIQPQIFAENWKTGLFDCMDDPMSAVITFLCPCVTFGQVAEILDNGQTSCATSGLMLGLVWFFLGLPCILSCTYRTKLRNRFGLVESPAPDWVTHFLCDCCAICQEYRELQLRGLDPSIGWQGNVARVQAGFVQQQANMNAPPNQRMMP